MSIRINGNTPAEAGIQKVKQDAITKQSPSENAPGQVKKSEESMDPEVVLELGTNEPVSGNYQKPTTPKSEVRSIEALRQQAEEALAPLRQMVEELLKQQGVHYNNSGLHIGQIKNRLEGKDVGNDKAIENGSDDNSDEMVEITPEMQTEAAKQIGEGGAFSPEVLSDRLVEFAKSISGEDKSKFKLLKDSILKGFDEAEKAWGGELPEISMKTKELTMKKLEAWSNES